MNILDVALAGRIAASGGGGGGSGTDNYNDLSNLPKINGTTLNGDKSSSSLGLQSEIKEGAELASDLVDDSESDNKFVTSAEKLEWSGKQDLIDNSHKLSSDLVSDADKTNKFVTASEKEAWNGKQNLIDNSHKLSSDLVDDTNKTNKFVTSTEKNTWNAKQNAIDSEHKLSSSLVSFSTAEAAALSSGIDSTKVGQISTNQTNILLVESMNGGKNLCNVWGRSGIVTGIKVENTDIGTVRVYGTSTGSSPAAIGLHDIITLPAGNYYFYRNRQGSSVQGTSIQYFKNNTYIASINSDTAYAFTLTEASEVQFKVYFLAGQTVDAVYKPMIITKAAYDAGFTDYQPYALPNYDLTRLEAEDRAALVEEIDSGAKNKLDFANTTTTESSCILVKSTTGVTISSPTSSNANVKIALPTMSGTSVLYWNVSNSVRGTSTKQLVRIYTNGNGTGTPVAEKEITSTGKYYVEWTAASNTTYYCFIFASANALDNQNTITVTDFMVCTLADWKVSQKFVPYYNPASPVLGGGYDIPQNSSMDSLISIGKWRCYNSDIATTVTNAPFRTGFFGWTMNSIADSARYIQIAIENTNVFNIAKRRWDGTSWSAWAYISSDAVDHYKADTTTTIGTDWTLTSIALQAPVEALVSMSVVAIWGAKAPRGIRITRTNTSATNNVIATIEVSEDKGQIQASGFGTKLNGVNTYYVWAKAKESGTMPVYLTYSYPKKD